MKRYLGRVREVEEECLQFFSYDSSSTPQSAAQIIVKKKEKHKKSRFPISPHSSSLSLFFLLRVLRVFLLADFSFSALRVGRLFSAERKSSMSQWSVFSRFSFRIFVNAPRYSLACWAATIRVVNFIDRFPSLTTLLFHEKSLHSIIELLNPI